MPRFLRYYLWFFLFMVILTYSLGWIDIVSNDLLTGSILRDILKSFPYYIEWILPYWWLIILVGALMLAVLSLIIRQGILFLRKR